MKDKTKKERAIVEHHTSTGELVKKLEACTNPVTASIYRDIIANRIGLNERNELIKKARNYSAQMYLEGCTYSFDGRQRMRKLFDLWFMN